MVGDMSRLSIAVRMELADDLPQIAGDRVQLQQVLMNLMANSIDAMKDADGTRELAINSQRGQNAQLMVTISDTGRGACRPSKPIRFSTPSLPRSPMGPAWDFASVALLLNRMAAGYGHPIVFRAAPTFTSPSP